MLTAVAPEVSDERVDGAASQLYRRYASLLEEELNVRTDAQIKAGKVMGGGVTIMTSSESVSPGLSCL